MKKFLSTTLLLIVPVLSSAQSLADSELLTQLIRIKERREIGMSIVECQQQIDQAQALIDYEKRLADAGNPNNVRALYIAGETIVRCEDSIKENYALYRLRGGANTLAEVRNGHVLTLQEQEVVDRASALSKRNLEKVRSLTQQADESGDQLQLSRADWSSVAAARIRKFWVRPSASPDVFRCRIAMQLAPDGQVLSVKIIDGCGTERLDRSVESAVMKASPMPLPADPKALMPNMTVNFCPYPATCQ